VLSYLVLRSLKSWECSILLCQHLWPWGHLLLMRIEIWHSQKRHPCYNTLITVVNLKRSNRVIRALLKSQRSQTSDGLFIYLFFILHVQLEIAMTDKYICVRNWHLRKNSWIADIVSQVCEQRRSCRTQVILSVTEPFLDSVSSYFAA